jgi:hypothetical protein
MNAGIDEVAKNEIDDPVLSSKWNSRLGAFAGQGVEPGAFASSQYDAQNFQVRAGFEKGFLWVKPIVRHAVLLKLHFRGKVIKDDD